MEEEELTGEEEESERMMMGSLERQGRNIHSASCLPSLRSSSCDFLVSPVFFFLDSALLSFFFLHAPLLLWQRSPSMCV